MFCFTSANLKAAVMRRSSRSYSITAHLIYTIATIKTRYLQCRVCRMECRQEAQRTTKRYGEKMDKTVYKERERKKMERLKGETRAEWNLWNKITLRRGAVSEKKAGRNKVTMKSCKNRKDQNKWNQSKKKKIMENNMKRLRDSDAYSCWQSRL